MNVFAEKLSRKSSTIVSLSSTFGNRFANFANDGSPTTYHLTDVNENIVWFEVDLGKPYSINNFKLYYRKKGISNKKKIYTKQWRHYDGLLLWLKKTKSNVGFTENKIQSLKEMHRLRHFYMDASNLSASTSTTTQRTCCYRNSTECPEVRPNILNMACKQRSTSFWRPRTTTLTIGVLLDFSIKNVYILKYTFFNTKVKSKSGSKFSYAFKQFNGWFAFIEYECKRPVNNDRK